MKAIANFPANPTMKIHPNDVPNAYDNGCHADFGGYGGCVVATGHDGPHRDANGYGWTDAHAANVAAWHIAYRRAASARNSGHNIVTGGHVDFGSNAELNAEVY